MQAQQLAGIGDVDQRQRVVQFGADLEQGDYGEALHARSDAARRAGGFRDDQGQLVADIDMEAPRGDLAEDDAELARLEVVQAALDDVLTDDGNLALLLRVDAVDQHRQHIALVRQHALQFGERRRADHLAVPKRRVGDGLPVVQRLRRADGGMRHHAEDPRAHFLLEAVHHREHDDHRQHAQRQADHRGQRDERDVVVAAFGAGVAQAYEER